jgi:hypothetical protein
VYQSLSASEKTKSNGPGSVFTSSCASPSRASMKGARPASSKFLRASAWRAGSISSVTRRPPVFESAQAIQIAECPVEVPISSARV